MSLNYLASQIPRREKNGAQGCGETNNCSHTASAIATFMDRVRKGFTECKVAELDFEECIGICQVEMGSGG